MTEEFEGEISVRGNPAITTQFFYVMRAMGLATESLHQLEHGPTIEARREAAQRTRAALTALRENLQRVEDLLNDEALPVDAQAMFAETLASQKRSFEGVNARLEAALLSPGLRDT